ncbi:MAG TPA: TetR/AcrR family transcriptional regulator [Acidimicrobiales bacterium]|nr:MAG: TetR family transcriptional regulator [Actinobacteria bacterium 21-73-9]HQU27234.1 TetR/AcrR family transcriptional regulator [Acidimicrobiales bacterium]
MSSVLSYIRDPAGATRRDQILAAAARLFAERGFHGVTIEGLGEAVGISGPAVYKHFASKDAVLGELLVGVSESLLAGALAVVADAPHPGAALAGLVAFHTDFALTGADLIRVQDRDLANLSAPSARRVRSLQRAYLELWVGALRRVRPDLAVTEARVRVHGAFGLLNSTSHSGPDRTGAPVAPLLARMALRALES